MPEIGEILANPKVLAAIPKVISTGTFGLEYALQRRTRQELFNLAHGAIEGLEIQLDANKCLASIASRIEGQGTEWGYELEHRRHLRSILEIDREVEERCLFTSWFPRSYFDLEFAYRFDDLMRLCNCEIRPDIMAKAELINASGELPEVLNDESSSLTDQRNSQLQGPQQADVPSLMASCDTMKNDGIKREALRTMQALETLFRRVKAAAILLLPHLGNKEMEEGPKEVLQEIIIDLFDDGHDMWLLRRYVDRLQSLKPRITDTVLRQRVITKFEAGKFDRATSRLANRLKYQLSSLERIAGHARSCDIRPRDGPRPSLEETKERAIWEASGLGSPGFDAKDLMNYLIIKGKASKARSLFDGEGLDYWEYDGSFLGRLNKKLEDWDDRQDLFQTLGQDFVEAVFEVACDLWQVNTSVLGVITLKLRELFDHTQVN